MTTLFIADLHLHDERPDLTRAFLQFLSEKVSGASTLYILGDLFEAWVGDDDDSETACSVKGALKQLTDNGTKVGVQHGNRDFLIGEKFAEETGTSLLADIEQIDLYGLPALIMHGDQLCTDDIEYQKFKNLVRAEAWQQEFLSKSLSERKTIARQIRADSRSSQSEKSMSIMDVNPTEVDRIIAEYQVNTLIHGHTHRPYRHQLSSGRQRIVLGDWDTQLWYLQCDADQTLTLVKQTITN